MKKIKQHAEDFVLICEHMHRRVAHDIDREAVRGSNRRAAPQAPAGGWKQTKLVILASRLGTGEPAFSAASTDEEIEVPSPPLGPVISVHLPAMSVGQ